MFQFDLKLLHRVENLDQKEQKDAYSTGRTLSTEASSRLEVTRDLRRQWKDIEYHQFHFNQSYLKDGQLIEFWEKGLKRIRIVLASKAVSANQVQMREDYQEIVSEYNRCACSLYDTLCDIAGESAIEDCILDLVRERWMRLDDLFDCHLRTSSGDEDVKYSNLRTAPTW